MAIMYFMCIFNAQMFCGRELKKTFPLASQMKSLCISFSVHFCYSVEKNGNITTRGKISILVLDLLLLLSFFLSFSPLFCFSKAG